MLSSVLSGMWKSGKWKLDVESLNVFGQPDNKQQRQHILDIASMEVRTGRVGDSQCWSLVTAQAAPLQHPAATYCRLLQANHWQWLHLCLATAGNISDNLLRNIPDTTIFQHLTSCSKRGPLTDILLRL